jgi:hypothetical protein
MVCPIIWRAIGTENLGIGLKSLDLGWTLQAVGWLEVKFVGLNDKTTLQRDNHLLPQIIQPNKCPVFTKIVQPSLLKGWCKLIWGLLIHDPGGYRPCSSSNTPSTTKISSPP